MLRQSMYVQHEGKTKRLTIRNYRLSDMDALIDIQRASFPPPFPEELWWNPEQIGGHISRFPAGALCAEMDGQVIGSMTALVLPPAAEAEHLPWEAATDNGYIRHHDPAGRTLYVVDLCVRPEYRNYGIGQWMMEAMYATVVHLGLDRLLGGARMPGYGAVANEMTAEQYVQEVMEGRRHDPVVSFLLRCGRTPIAVVPDYLEDEQSANYGLLMEWRNPFL